MMMMKRHHRHHYHQHHYHVDDVDLGILTVRIRWRLSGNTETKQIHYMCTVKVMKEILERELDETAQQKTRVRLFLGSQELYQTNHCRHEPRRKYRVGSYGVMSRIVLSSRLCSTAICIGGIVCNHCLCGGFWRY